MKAATGEQALEKADKTLVGNCERDHYSLSQFPSTD